MEDSIAVMRSALQKGANFWNGGEIYGTPEYNSLHLLKAYFTKYPEDADKVVISIKGGFDGHAPNGSPEFIRKCIEGDLKLLDGKGKIDIWELARVDKKIPLETTIKALDEHVKAGNIGGIGLSEVGAETIRRAAAVAKIAAVEVEFSLFSTDILENGVAEACAENGITLIAYSPLSRGLLTGQIRSHGELSADDWRLKFNLPRFQPGNLEKNMELVREVEKLAEGKGAAPGQVAIAWIRQLSGRNGLPTIIPIPGTTTEQRLSENMKEVSLTDDDMKTLNEMVKKCTVHGDRESAMMKPLQWA